MNKYISRITSSQRGQKFNPLIWPFFIATMSYGIGFTIFLPLDIVTKSSLFMAMFTIHPWIPVIWGILAIATIVMGLTFLLFNIPPVGRLSGLLGFMVWVFASMCWLLDGNFLLIFSVGLANMYFWFWQYLSLSLFRREDAQDIYTMDMYDRGQYDDEENPKDSKAAREDNRGRDRQTEGRYDDDDNGLDESRQV